jgi:hypothetical protein
LLTEIQNRGTLVRTFYYTAVVEDKDFMIVQETGDVRLHTAASSICPTPRARRACAGRQRFGWALSSCDRQGCDDRVSRPYFGDPAFESQ